MADPFFPHSQPHRYGKIRCTRNGPGAGLACAGTVPLCAHPRASHLSGKTSNRATTASTRMEAIGRNISGRVSRSGWPLPHCIIGTVCDSHRLACMYTILDRSRSPTGRHAHRIASNQDNLELSLIRERGLHVEIMDWLQIWVVANALLLACWILRISGEMRTRDRINYRAWVISGRPEVELSLNGDPKKSACSHLGTTVFESSLEQYAAAFETGRLK